MTTELKFGDITVLTPQFDNLTDFATKTQTGPGVTDLYELEMSKGVNKVPDQQVLEQAKNINRTVSTKGKGLYQIATRAERESLRRGLMQFAGQIGIEAEKLGYMVDYLPNARIGYLNKLIKKALEGIATGTKTIYPADIHYVSRINTLNFEAKETLIKLLSKALNENQDGYSVEPTPTRSSIQLNDKEGLHTGTYIKLKNPGNVYLPMNQPQDEFSYDAFNEIMQTLNEKLSRLNDEMEFTSDFRGLLQSPIFEKPGSNLTKSLLAIKDKLLDRHITYKDAMDISRQLNDMTALNRSKYLLSIADPFKHKTARIPTLIDPPSAVFSLKAIVPLTTNASGNVAFSFAPFALFVPGTNFSSFGVNNNVGLTGSASSNFFLGVDIGQNLPANFYVKYRLVSSAIRVFFYPSSNNDNGICSVSVCFATQNTAAVASPINSAAQFGNFNLIENGFFKVTQTLASREVLESGFIPLDESFWDYQDLNTAKAGWSWQGYITGATASTTIARVELVLNIEALIDPNFTDYLPSESPADESDPKMVFSVIHSLKQDNVAINPNTVQRVIQEKNMAYIPETEIKLPLTPKELKSKREEIEEVVGNIKRITKGVLENIPQKEKSNWLSSVMNFLNPMASAIVQHVAGAMNPYMALPFKI